MPPEPLHLAREIGAPEVRRLRSLWQVGTWLCAYKLGVHESTWRRWEAGLSIPQPANRAELARMLNQAEKGLTQ